MLRNGKTPRAVVYSLVATVLIGLTLAGCQSEDTVASSEGRGVVLRLDAAHHALTLDHGAVPRMMQPFVMSYPVENVSMLKGLHVNDSVRFTLTNSSAGTYVVTAIERLKPPKKK